MTKRSWRLSGGLLLTFLLLAPPLPAQQASTEELKKEIEALSQMMKAMQKDLQEIKALLQSRVPAAPPQNVVLDLDGNPSQGENAAKLTLVEFSDYQ